MKNKYKGDVTKIKDNNMLRVPGDYVKIKLCVLFLDDNDTILSKLCFRSGFENKVNVPTEEIIRVAREYNCSRLVMIHNHPYGAEISTEDILITQKIEKILLQFGIRITANFVYDSVTEKLKLINK